MDIQDTLKKLHPFVVSKVEEFKLLGYEDVTDQKLIQFLTNKTWKKLKEERQLHQLVNDIMKVSVGDYMNFMTVESFKSPNWFSSEEGMSALKDLL